MKKLRIMLAAAACAVMVLTTACGENKGNSGNAGANIVSNSVGLSHGTWSGTTYTSNFLGIKGDFGSDWTITSDSELASAQGISDMSAENMKSVMSSAGVVSEMMITKADQSSVNIVIEDTAKTKTPTGDKYFETMPDLAKQQFKALGLDADISNGTVSFCGENTRGFSIVLNMEGISVYEVQVPIFKDGYIASITFAASSKEAVDALVAMFTKA